MDSTFLRMLAVPSSKQDLPNFYPQNIPNFLNLHPKSFGMDPSAPIIIATINVSLSQILAIFKHSSE